MSLRSNASTARFNKTASSLRLVDVPITRVHRHAVNAKPRLKVVGAVAAANQTSTTASSRREKEEGKC